MEEEIVNLKGRLTISNLKNETKEDKVLNKL